MMLLRRTFVLVALFALFTFTAGCGKEAGVAEGPDEPAPELTPEEEQGEREYQKSLQEN